MTLPIIKQDGNRPYSPRHSLFSSEFWESLAEGVFKTTRCNNCNQFSFPPGQHCSVCWSSSNQWVELSGTGRLYARTTVYAAPDIFKDKIPYSVGIVDLDEGIRVIASLLDENDNIMNDDNVELLVLDYSDGPLFAARKLCK